MCEHRFSLDLKDLKPVSKCTQCRIWELDALRQQLAAANARIAEMEKELIWFKANGQELIKLHQQKAEALLDAANNETHKANLVIESLKHERSVLYKICAERQDSINQLEAQNKAVESDCLDFQSTIGKLEQQNKTLSKNIDFIIDENTKMKNVLNKIKNNSYSCRYDAYAYSVAEVIEMAKEALK